MTERSRKPIPEAVQHRILDRSRRRCALCVHFDTNYDRKEGQIAHIDRDSSNAEEDNLVYLCLQHHDDYDTTRRQTKNLTAREVRTARDRLYDFIEHGGDVATGPQPRTGIETDWKTLVELQALMAKVPDYLLSRPNFGGCSVSMHEVEAFRAVIQKRNKPEHEFVDPALEELHCQFIAEGQVLLGVMEKPIGSRPTTGLVPLADRMARDCPRSVRAGGEDFG